MPPPPPVTTSEFARRPSEAPVPPPSPPRGRAARIVARVMLWGLITVGALRGLVPLPAPPGPSTAAVPARPGQDGQAPRPGNFGQEQAATATAAAFLREYLTVGGDPAARPARLKRFLARGLDLDGSVSSPAGTSQYPDYVLPAAVRPLEQGVEVTVLAHLLQARSGAAHDGGTVAFVVPMVDGPKGAAVSGMPRPAPLPVDPALTTRLVALPAALAHTAAIAAGQAVVALLNGDSVTLAKLGGGAVPEARPLPDGWRAVGIAGIRPAGPPEAPTVQVLVRARPPTAGIEYLVPVRVSLRPGRDGLLVRQIDGGDMP